MCLSAGFLPLYTVIVIAEIRFWPMPTLFFLPFFFLMPACLLYTVLYYDHEILYTMIYYICIYTHQSGTVNNELKAYASPETGFLLTNTRPANEPFSMADVGVLTQPACPPLYYLKQNTAGECTGLLQENAVVRVRISMFKHCFLVQVM